MAEGKDLTRVKTIIGTGGPLTRLPGGLEILGSILNRGKVGSPQSPSAEA